MIISRPCALLETFVGRGPSRFLSHRRQFHQQPASPKAKCVAPGRKGPRASGQTCFVLSRAKPPNVTSTSSSMQAARTNLESGVGNTDDNLCNWVQLPGVNVFLVLRGCGITDLSEDSAKFERLV